MVVLMVLLLIVIYIYNNSTLIFDIHAGTLLLLLLLLLGCGLGNLLRCNDSARRVVNNETTPASAGGDGHGLVCLYCRRCCCWHY